MENIHPKEERVKARRGTASTGGGRGRGRVTSVVDKRMPAAIHTNSSDSCEGGPQATTMYKSRVVYKRNWGAHEFSAQSVY